MTIFFIKKIWQNETDDSVHSQFIRFSRGKFAGRFVTGISRNGKCKLNTTFELANNLVVFASSLVPKIKASGILLTRENPKDLLQKLGINTPVKKKAAIFETNIDAELTQEQAEAMEKEAYFMLFDCEAEGISLKMKKKKLPRPSKSETGKINDKFCILEADIKHFPKVKEEFAFGIKEDFKKAYIKHTIEVNDVIIPPMEKGEKDFEKLRLNAKKKGKISRIITINGSEKSEEKDFVA